MKRLLLAGLIFATAGLYHEQSQGQELCHISFSSGARLLLPVARSWQEQEQGLSGRLDAGPGLLFVWEEAVVRTLWMKNTYIPLSAAFIGTDDRVLQIVDMESASEDRHASPAPVKAVIEMAQGDFKRLGITEGSSADIRCADDSSGKSTEPQQAAPSP